MKCLQHLQCPRILNEVGNHNHMGLWRNRYRKWSSSYPQRMDREKWKCKIETVNRFLQTFQCLLFHNEFNRVLNHSSPLHAMHRKYKDRKLNPGQPHPVTYKNLFVKSQKRGTRTDSLQS